MHSPLSSGSADALNPPLQSKPSVADHELLGVIAHGGYGTVWLARNSIGTLRAVKVVHRNQFKDPRPYERELQGIRNFEPISRQHEGLVDILHVGNNDAIGYFYCVMELADPARSESEPPATSSQNPQPWPRPHDRAHGIVDYKPRTLRTDIIQGRQPLADCLRVGIAMAEALSFLHAQGLVHRDIKPSNVIFVGGLPKLADMGLVSLDGEAHSWVGTQGYAPPEGQGTAKGDIYSLGKVLYEMVTGKPCIEFPNPATTIEPGDDPGSLAEFNHIVLRACDPNPATRYASVQALLDDLRLLQAGRSVRRIRSLERNLRIARRAVYGLLAALIVAIGVGTVLNRQAKTIRDLAGRERTRLARLHVSTASRLMDEGDVMASLPWLVEALKLEESSPERVSVHRLRIGMILRQSPRIQVMGFHSQPINYSEFSPDGRWVVTASDDSTARVWNASTGDPITEPLPHGKRVLQAIFSPDGKRIATASADGTAKIWDAVTGRPVTGPMSHGPATGAGGFGSYGSNLVAIAFSPDGHLLATASWDSTARVWNAETGQPIGRPLPHKTLLGVKTIAFSPNGRWIATGGYDQTARLWNVSTGEPVIPPMQHPDDVRHLAFSADSRWLLTACGDGGGRLWDTQTGGLKFPPFHLGDGGPVWHVAFSPDGSRVVIAGGLFGKSGESRVWDLKTGEPVSPPCHLPLPSRSACFSPDGRWLATASGDGTVRFTDVESGEPVLVPLRHRLAVWNVAFSADGHHVLTSGRDGSWQVWNLVTRDSLESVASHDASVHLLACSADRTRVVSAGRDHVVRIWDADTLAPVSKPIPFDGTVAAIAMSVTGRRFATACSDGTARVWNADTGQPSSPLLRHNSAVHAISLSPDDRVLATGTDDGTVHCWDWGTGRETIPPLHHRYQVSTVEFSHDGKLLATGAGEHMVHQARGEVAVWNAISGACVLGPLDCPGQTHPFAFSPDNTTLAFGESDISVGPQSAHLLDTSTGRLLGPPLVHNDDIETIEFTRDGQTLLTASGDGTAQLWEVRTGKMLPIRLQHRRYICAAAFSRNNRQILTASSDGTARLWDATTGEPISASLQHLGRVWTGCFGRDDASILTACEDHTIHRWVLSSTDLSVNELADLADLLSGQHWEGLGNRESTSPQKRLELLHRLQSRSPEVFRDHRTDEALWHQRQLASAERLPIANAVSFHRRWLERLQSVSTVVSQQEPDP